MPVAVELEVVADLEVIKPHTPEWHAARRTGFGGSDAAAVAGVSKWRTPYEKWVEKTSEAPPATEDPELEPEYITWGKILEPVVRETFTERTGIPVTTFTKMVRNKAYPYMLANVDGLTLAPDTSEFTITGIYEGKTAWNDWWNGGEVEVPIDYVLQGMHYMAVLGLDVVHYACLVGGQKLRIAEVERNDKVIDDLIAIEGALWDAVEEGTPPPVGPGDVATLKKNWTSVTGKSVELLGTHVPMLKNRLEYQARIETAKFEIDRIDAEIMRHMGDAEIGNWQGETLVTWKTDKRGRVSNELLEAAGIKLDDYRSAPGRRFLVK